MSTPTPIAVLGAGTWGITLAALLATTGRPVRAWDVSRELTETLRRDRAHPRLPKMSLPDTLTVSDEVADALEGADTVVVVVPSHAVRELGRRLAAEKLLTARAEIVLCSKGIEEKTLRLMTQVIEDELGADVAQRTAVLSGPSHAEEVSQGVPTAVVAAASNPELARRAQALFTTERFRVYTQGDVLGVELAGALKNVIAIACGACAGLGFGDNTVAALITRGLAEITRLGKRLGAQPETFAGLAGVGDLIVTALSRHSRNSSFGRLLAEGRTPDDAQREIGMVVEGVRTARAAHALSRREEIRMPITDAVVAVLDGRLSTRDAVDALMLADPKPEIYQTLDEVP